MLKQGVLVGLTIVLITLGLSGCTQQDSSDQTHIQTTSPTTESLETILAKTDAIKSMSFEILATIDMSEFDTQTATIKIWQKPSYLKEQVTTMSTGTPITITVIHRPDGNYTYDVAQAKYVLTPNVTSFATSLQYFDSKMIKDLLNNQTVLDFETETIDGKQATIIQYSLPLQGDNLMSIKMWIWNERGVPLKAYIDMTTEEISMTMDFVFSNYSFSDIPDSMFSVS